MPDFKINYKISMCDDVRIGTKTVQICFISITDAYKGSNESCNTKSKTNNKPKIYSF